MSDCGYTEVRPKTRKDAYWKINDIRQRVDAKVELSTKECYAAIKLIYFGPVDQCRLMLSESASAAARNDKPE
jgi:hypothetical protein